MRRPETAAPPLEPRKRPLVSASPSEPPKPSKIPRPLEEDQEDAPRGGLEEEEHGGGEQHPRMNPRPGSQRYLVAVEYIGTRFSGSQKQPNCRTVAGVLEEAFHKFIGQPASIYFSSRTDAGVHALSNVCHVDVERISKKKPGEVLPPHEPGVVKRAVNHFLHKHEGDITVIDVQCVPADYHARFKALERTYFYRILSGPDPLSTFEKERAWHVPQELDLLAMKKACRALVGYHDFSSFRAAGCQANSPIRTLDELHVLEVVPSLYFPSSVERREMESNNEELKSSTECSIASNNDAGSFRAESGKEFGQRARHRCYVITARARSFLYHQVRLMVGVLKSVGTGDLTASDVERILDAKTVTAASPIAPACGLYLANVKYRLP